MCISLKWQKYYNITAESIYNITKISKREFCRNFIVDNFCIFNLTEKEPKKGHFYFSTLYSDTDAVTRTHVHLIWSPKDHHQLLVCKATKKKKEIITKF